MSEYVIKLDNVGKRFQNAVVLDHITLSFEKGRIYGLIGRNGSGKTMLLKCICGFVVPTSGKITVNGMDLGQSDYFTRDMGIIIETPGFLPDYTGYENLRYLAKIRGRIGKEEIRNAIVKVGLDPDDKKKVGKYSLGMRQRLGIAQAIMENPSILLLDEPMNGLDNQGVEEMRQLLLDLKEEGTTIILASHSREDIEILCDGVAMLDKGHCISHSQTEGK